MNMSTWHFLPECATLLKHKWCDSRSSSIKWDMSSAKESETRKNCPKNVVPRGFNGIIIPRSEFNAFSIIHKQWTFNVFFTVPAGFPRFSVTAVVQDFTVIRKCFEREVVILLRRTQIIRISETSATEDVDEWWPKWLLQRWKYARFICWFATWTRCSLIIMP